MRLTDLFPSIGGDTLALGVSENAQTVQQSDVFVAIRGTKSDGHDYIGEAIANGASAIVVSRDDIAEGTIPVIKVADTRFALSRLAQAFFPESPTMVVAVTGTNGKTSTVEFLRQIWRHIGWQAVSIGTLGITGVLGTMPDTTSPLTTPDAITLHKTLDRLARAGVSHLAIEASSHALNQHRLAHAKIAVAGFTNLTHDHLDYHRDMEDYFTAKSRLFTDILLEGGTAVINIDSDWGLRLRDLVAHRPISIMTVGRDATADFRIMATEPHAYGLAVTLRHRGGDYTLPLALSGDFQASNAVMAAALAHASGLALGHALMGLAYIHSAPGRMQLIGGHPKGAKVVVDYAHSPDALKKALMSLRHSTAKRLGVVFGCGGDRDRAKRKVMGEIAGALADFAIITDDNPRGEDPSTIRAEIIASCPQALEEGDRYQAIAEGINRLECGDILLIAGKGNEDQQLIGNETLPFSDAATAHAIMSASGANMLASQRGAE